MIPWVTQKYWRASGLRVNRPKAQATAIREIMDERTATKQDLRELELRLKYDLTIRLGGIVVACTAILLGALPLLLK